MEAMPPSSSLLLILVALALPGCGSTNPADPTDAGASPDSSVPRTDGSPALDSSVSDATTSDATTSDATNPDAAGCGSLSADPPDVYVDKGSVLNSVGTAACPFHAISEATALPAPIVDRTIHLRGSSPAHVYDETTVIVVRPGETLLGDDEETTVITGGGACTIGPCVVSVRGGSLSGVSVISETGTAIEIPIGSGDSVVDSVSARDCLHEGFYVRANATLSNVTAIRNNRNGLNARFGTVTITNSRFDQNDRNGIKADRSVIINFSGGSASGNDSAGILLQDTSTVTGSLLHSLSDLQIIQNLGFGIHADSTASIILRGTSMRSNEVGLVFTGGVSNSLDIGSAEQNGGNRFGGLTQRNIRAGLCIKQSGDTGNQVGEGNTWAACSPTQSEINSFTCRAQSSYSDVGYIPTGKGGAPLSLPIDCTIGQ